MKRCIEFLLLAFLLTSCQSGVTPVPGHVTPSASESSTKVTSSLLWASVTPATPNHLFVTSSPGTGQPQIRATLTASTLEITPTSTATINPTNPIFTLIHRIYGWTTGGHIGFFDLTKDGSSGWNEFYAGEYRPEGPNLWSSLIFSPYTDNIAYLAGTDTAELWITDLDLKRPERVWIDKDEWLGYVGGISSTHILWGINGRYLLLVPLSPENHVVIHDAMEKSTIEWSGTCDLLAESPVSEDLVIWCKYSGNDPNEGYIVLGKEEIIKTKEEPKVTARVIDWAYSPDGERLLFADEDLNIFTTLPDGNLLQLPATYESSEFFDISIRQNLQWSQDGRNVLVYAYGNPRSLCPQWMREKLEDRPCWLVFDASTGKVVWNPTGEITGLSVPWESLTMVHGAALSPDGKWLAMISFDMSKPGRTIYLLVASIKENKIIIMEGEEITHLHWEQEE